MHIPEKRKTSGDIATDIGHISSQTETKLDLKYSYSLISPQISLHSVFPRQCLLRLKKIEPRSKSREKRDKKITQVAPVAQKRQKVLAEAKKTDHDICRILHWVKIYHFSIFPPIQHEDFQPR